MAALVGREGEEGRLLLVDAIDGAFWIDRWRKKKALNSGRADRVWCGEEA
jgi:hypothetical protein